MVRKRVRCVPIVGCESQCYTYKAGICLDLQSHQALASNLKFTFGSIYANVNTPKKLSAFASKATAVLAAIEAGNLDKSHVACTGNDLKMATYYIANW